MAIKGAQSTFQIREIEASEVTGGGRSSGCSCVADMAVDGLDFTSLERWELC